MRNPWFELRYFLTSLTDVKKAAFAMRAHWSIENNLHWVLDTIFHEDYCLVRKDNSAANMNILRKIALNILKHVDFSDIIKQRRCRLFISNTCATNVKIASKEPCYPYNAESLGKRLSSIVSIT